MSPAILFSNISLHLCLQTLVKVPPWAKEILGKDPLVRTEADCKKLHALLRGMTSFDKFTQKIQLAMCKAFTYQWLVKCKN